MFCFSKADDDLQHKGKLRPAWHAVPGSLLTSIENSGKKCERWCMAFLEPGPRPLLPVEAELLRRKEQEVKGRIS